MKSKKRPNGQSKSSNPSHLLQTAHGYYWRLRVPRDIQHIVGRQEMRYSRGEAAHHRVRTGSNNSVTFFKWPWNVVKLTYWL